MKIETSFYTRETIQQQRKYTPKRQAGKPNKAVESVVYDSRGAPWFPVKLIYILAALMVECGTYRDQGDPDEKANLLK